MYSLNLEIFLCSNIYWNQVSHNSKPVKIIMFNTGLLFHFHSVLIFTVVCCCEMLTLFSYRINWLVRNISWQRGSAVITSVVMGGVTMGDTGGVNTRG